MLDVTLGLAFFAGLVSFISPCVLPLVPAYIGYMGGRVTNTIAAQVDVSGSGEAVARGPSLAARFSTMLHGTAFVIGFTAVFVIIGILGTAFIGTFNTATVTDLIGRVGGVVIIFFALHFMGVLPSVFNWIRQERAPMMNALLVAAIALIGGVIILWGFGGQLDIWNSRYWGTNSAWVPASGVVALAIYVVLLFIGGAFTTPTQFLNKSTNTLDQMLYADTRREMDATGNKGLISSGVMGVVFAAGWTPCIGPIYGAILTMSATTGDVAQAAPLLTAYSLGLGIPFLLTALMLDSAQGFLRRLNRHMQTIKLVSGMFLLLIGLAIASGQLQSLSQQWSGQFADLSVRIEECSVGWVEGDIWFNQLGDCLSGAATFDQLHEETLQQAALPTLELVDGGQRLNLS